MPTASTPPSWKPRGSAWTCACACSTRLSQPYGKELRDLILRAVGPGPCEARQFALLHRLLGETFAAAARQVADRASFSLQRVQCLGCPGHTVWHDPEGRFPATLGLGMAAVVAERTGVTTVSDFRARDVVAGGQGVPLGRWPTTSSSATRPRTASCSTSAGWPASSTSRPTAASTRSSASRPARATCCSTP